MTDPQFTPDTDYMEKKIQRDELFRVRLEAAYLDKGYVGLHEFFARELLTIEDNYLLKCDWIGAFHLFLGKLRESAERGSRLRCPRAGSESEPKSVPATER